MLILPVADRWLLFSMVRAKGFHFSGHTQNKAAASGAGLMASVNGNLY